MRNALTTMVGMAFFLMVACGGGNGNTTGGTNGSPTGGTATTGGVGVGGPCNTNDQCASDACGIDGISGGAGLCCATQCVGVGTNICAQPIGCDDGGVCVYHPKGTDCGTTCAGNMRRQNSCDGAGGCSPGTASECMNGLGCGATDCNSYCGSDGGCANDYFCSGIGSNGQGTCTQQNLIGPCVEDQQCQSGQCAGLSSTVTSGFCCALPCPHDKYPECVATACTSDAGACVYPPKTTICDKQDQSCSGSILTAGLCDGMGTCDKGDTPCPNHLACSVSSSDGCALACAGDVNCATGFYCQTNGALPNLGSCLAKGGDGGCDADDQCISGVCGSAGKGAHCCAQQCLAADPVCGSPDCDGTTALCEYPDAGTVCGKTLESCAKDVQQNPSICDGLGNCPTPGTVQCSPYACNVNGSDGCYTSCTDVTSCNTGDFCHLAASACCATLTPPLIMVDAVTGKDAACCGFGNNIPCLTITYAMNMIANSQTTGVIIQATIMGGVGTWNPAGEVYPIKLGWGVELQASGIAFWDPKNVGAEIFDIAPFTGDTSKSASIFGNLTAAPVIIGFDQKDANQSKDASAIQVEAGQTLYLAHANINSNATAQTTAITVVPGGTLTLGEDQSTKNTGTVTIGNTTNQAATLGWTGILCGAALATSACTINDVTQLNNGSSVVIEGQEHVDIDAEDSAAITLTANPTVGVSPGKPGFNACAGKIDANNGLAAILLHGSANVTYSNGSVQCISGDAFELIASTLTPTLTLNTDIIQNTEHALGVSAGTATITGTTIRYNYNGVSQSSNGTIDLSGGNNTVICSSDVESVAKGQMTPGVNVLNSSTSTLNASNVSWDTTGPDLFGCNAQLTACTCTNTCTNNPAADDMDAVTVSTGTITTTGAVQSMAAVAAGCK